MSIPTGDSQHAGGKEIGHKVITRSWEALGREEGFLRSATHGDSRFRRYMDQIYLFFFFFLFIVLLLFVCLRRGSY